MKTYITRSEALQRYPITENELDKLINAGDIDALELVDDGQNQTIFYDDDLAAYAAERDVTPGKFEHLRGNLLGMNEAGLKYGVTPKTISRWVAQGQLEVKKRQGQKKLVDAATRLEIIMLFSIKNLGVLV